MRRFLALSVALMASALFFGQSAQAQCGYGGGYYDRTLAKLRAAGPVTVTRMLMMQTIEERINQVLEEKRRLFESIFSNAAEPTSAGLTQEDIFGLFNLRVRGAAA